MQLLKGTATPVGASLLAIAECQSIEMLNVRPLSRAGSLPQVTEVNSVLLLVFAGRQIMQMTTGQREKTRGWADVFVQRVEQ